MNIFKGMVGAKNRFLGRLNQVGQNTVLVFGGGKHPLFNGLINKPSEWSRQGGSKVQMHGKNMIGQK